MNKTKFIFLLSVLMIFIGACTGDKSTYQGKADTDTKPPILSVMTSKIIDPYGSELVADYIKIIKDFGLDSFNANNYPDPNRLMRRGVVFAERDMKAVRRAMKEKKNGRHHQKSRQKLRRC